MSNTVSLTLSHCAPCICIIHGIRGFVHFFLTGLTFPRKPLLHKTTGKKHTYSCFPLKSLCSSLNADYHSQRTTIGSEEVPGT